MADPRALGNGPVDFTAKDGSQYSIPLSLISFDRNGKPQCKFENSSQPLLDWLDYLTKTGVLIKGTQPAPGVAMILSAKQPGAGGNGIMVEFRNVKADGSFDAQVTKTQTYSGLTAGPDDNTDAKRIQHVLGRAPEEGASPGMVYVLTPGATRIPKEEKTYTMTASAAAEGEAAGPASGPKYSVDIPANEGTAFTLAPADDSDGAQYITIATKLISSEEFSLVVTWRKQASGVTADQLEADFGYVLKVTPAEPGKPLLAPAPGIVTLAGGADEAAATAASAKITANS